MSGQELAHATGEELLVSGQELAHATGEELAWVWVQESVQVSAREPVWEVLPVSCLVSVHVLSWQPFLLGIGSGRMVLDKMEYVGFVVGFIVLLRSM